MRLCLCGLDPQSHAISIQRNTLRPYLFDSMRCRIKSGKTRRAYMLHFDTPPFCSHKRHGLQLIALLGPSTARRIGRIGQPIIAWEKSKVLYKLAGSAYQPLDYEMSSVDHQTSRQNPPGLRYYPNAHISHKVRHYQSDKPAEYLAASRLSQS